MIQVRKVDTLGRGCYVGLQGYGCSDSSQWSIWRRIIKSDRPSSYIPMRIPWRAALSCFPYWWDGVLTGSCLPCASMFLANRPNCNSSLLFLKWVHITVSFIPVTFLIAPLCECDYYYQLFFLGINCWDKFVYYSVLRGERHSTNAEPITTHWFIDRPVSPLTQSTIGK